MGEKKMSKGWLNTTIVRYPEIEKPCEKLGYCPYGQLVEEFPLHTESTKYAIENNKFVKMVNGQGWVSCNISDPEATPDLNWAVGKVNEPLACPIYGHDCPVHYHAELVPEKETVNGK
jgi:hypothetical protein